MYLVGSSNLFFKKKKIDQELLIFKKWCFFKVLILCFWCFFKVLKKEKCPKTPNLLYYCFPKTTFIASAGPCTDSFSIIV